MDRDTAIAWLKVFQRKYKEQLDKDNLWFQTSMTNAMQMYKAIDTILHTFDKSNIKVYLNLTNGIEFLDFPDFNIKDYRFVRIQSCACERHLWNKILSDLDYNFLIDLAIGNKVIVCDTSTSKLLSRALYQGVEFIQFALNKIWLNKDTTPYVRNMNCKDYFEKEFLKLEKSTLKKIKYLRKFLNTDNVEIICVGRQTEHDGDYEYYRKILLDNMEV